MVSGLVTSPCDQLRIRSGEARLMRMLSKSVTLFPRSNGLERYKVSSVSFCHSQSNDRRTELWCAQIHAPYLFQNLAELRRPSRRTSVLRSGTSALR